MKIHLKDYLMWNSFWLINSELLSLCVRYIYILNAPYSMWVQHLIFVWLECYSWNSLMFLSCILQTWSVPFRFENVRGWCYSQSWKVSSDCCKMSTGRQNNDACKRPRFIRKIEKKNFVSLVRHSGKCSSNFLIGGNLRFRRGWGWQTRRWVPVLLNVSLFQSFAHSKLRHLNDV